MMERMLDDKVSVAPQITPDNLTALPDEGVTTLICNRPDEEVPEALSADMMAEAAAAAGLAFAHVPLGAGGMTVEAIRAHLGAIDAAPGRVLAYCASGTRSAYLWAFAMALADRIPNEDILSALDRAGYPAPGLGQQLTHVRQIGF